MKRRKPIPAKNQPPVEPRESNIFARHNADVAYNKNRTSIDKLSKQELTEMLCNYQRAYPGTPPVRIMKIMTGLKSKLHDLEKEKGK